MITGRLPVISIPFCPGIRRWKCLGANLRVERHRRALTQEALAEHLGVTARYLAGIERGERNLTLDSVDLLASRLDLDALGLLTGGPQHP